MADPGAGLSIRERQALLMNNNKNPMLAGEPVKAAGARPSPAAKPTVSSPPPATAALKPVPGRKAPVAQGGAATASAGGKMPPAPLAKPGSDKMAVNGEAAHAGAGDGGSGGGGDAVSHSPFLKQLRHVEAPKPGGGGGGGGAVSGNHPPAAFLPPKKSFPTLPTSPTSAATSPPAAAASRSDGTALSDAKGTDSTSAGGGGGGVGGGGGFGGGGPRQFSSIKGKIAALQSRASFDGSDSAGSSGPGGHHAASPGPHPATGPASLTKAVHPAFTPPAPKPAPGLPGGQRLTPLHPKPAGPSLTLKPADLAKSLREAALRKSDRSSNIYVRNSDRKKFRKLDSEKGVSSGAPPGKPTPLGDVDLTMFVKAYAAAKEKKLEVDASKSDIPRSVADDGEPEELYVEAESTQVIIRKKGGSLKRANTVRVSVIGEYTEEEEHQDVYDDATSGEPQEEYDDCDSVQAKQPEPFDDPDEIYEPLDDDDSETHASAGSRLEAPKEPPPPPRSPVPSEDKKAKKEKEKGAKKKEKDDVSKTEEKERKKKEEIRKQRAKFGLTDTDPEEGRGVVKAKESGGIGIMSNNLAVKQGETVGILRMDKNPSGKWLVQNEHGKIGYVNSSNIEFMKTAAKKETQEPVEPDDPEELYEALPDEGEFDDIYEETT